MTTPKGFLDGGGDMGARIRAYDWSRTPLGDPPEWPQSLKTALGILLNSGYPMYIAWGERFTQFYNDAYRPILGSTKHPAALGRSTDETFAEIWDFIGPMFRSVIRTATASTFIDQLLPLDRHGYVEECYFTFSYSAIPREDGGVGGVFVTVLETTGRMLRERRLRTLRDLANMSGRSTATEICAGAAELLARNRHDVPFALIYRPEAEEAVLLGHTGIDGTAPALQRISLADGGPWGAIVARALGGMQREALPEPFLPDRAAWPEPVSEAIGVPVVPLGHDKAAAVLVAGISPRRALDADYADFFRAAAANIAGVIAEAEAYEGQRRRAEKLTELDRAKTAFFSNVSHEFRTPLTLLLGSLEDFLAGDPARVAGRDLEMAHRNGLRLLRLVNALLDFSRAEAARIRASYEPTDLASLTSELASNFRSACERAGLELIVDCELTAEPVYVDRDMWEKIVLNLLSNAFKYTLHGRIEVVLRVVQDARRVELAVKDTGIGIPAEHLAHVFERFHRIEGQRGRTQEGTGIGLALVQELVKLHGGTCRVESIEGTGSVFTVALPLGAEHLPPDSIGRPRSIVSTATGARAFVEEALRWLPDTPRAAELEALVEPNGTGECAASASADRILVADDNADMRDYLCRLLRRHYRVEAVPDGETALVAMRADPPDLVLTDVMMPRLDGFGLLRAIRADPQLREVPVVMLSARAGEEATIEGHAAGADDYLVKPFSTRELQARVASQLQLAKLRREAAEREQQYARELERKVLERTRELAETNRRLQAEAEERRDAEGERDRLFELLPDLLAILTFDGWLRRVSPSWTALLGYGADVLTAQQLLDLVHPDDREAMLSELGRLSRGRAVTRFENRLRHRDGSYRWLQWNARPARSLIYAVGRDMTEQKRAADRLRQAEEQLRQAQKLETVGQLTAGVAHDFNNLLTSILGSLELLEPRISDEAGARLLRGAIRSAQRGAQLNEQLLAFARKQPLIPRIVDLNAVVTGMDALLGSSIDDSIRVETVLGRDLWPAMADQTQLELVILNLAINARDAMSLGGRLTIETRNLTRGPPVSAEEPPAGDYVAVSVSDTGTGMSDEVRGKAIEPFFTTKEPGKGSGLGLSMVFGVARQSGGGVSLESRLGEGTTATVYLPRASEHARPERGAAPEAGEAPALVGDEVVLVVDDDGDVREVTTALLHSMGYRVVDAGSGAAAIDLLAQDVRIDAMLVDIAMPGMDGVETSRRARAVRPELPILFATGYADASRFADQIAPSRIVRKPFRRGELAEKLQAALGRVGSPGAASRSPAWRD